MTTYQAAQVQMHKDEKTAHLRPLAASPSDCRHGEKTLETVPHHLQHTWVSELQNKQLKKVLCSAAYLLCAGSHIQIWARLSLHGEISPVLAKTHPPGWKCGLR